MEDTVSTERKSLAVICSRAFSMIVTLGAGHNLGEFQSLRSRVTATFGEVERLALTAGYRFTRSILKRERSSGRNTSPRDSSVRLR